MKTHELGYLVIIFAGCVLLLAVCVAVCKWRRSRTIHSETSIQLVTEFVDETIRKENLDLPESDELLKQARQEAIEYNLKKIARLMKPIKRELDSTQREVMENLVHLSGYQLIGVELFNKEKIDFQQFFDININRHLEEFEECTS